MSHTPRTSICQAGLRNQKGNECARLSGWPQGKSFSRRIFTSAGSQKLLARSFEQSDDLLAPDTGKSLGKVVDGLPRFEMIEETLHRHACTNENWRASENLGIGVVATINTPFHLSWALRD